MRITQEVADGKAYADAPLVYITTLKPGETMKIFVDGAQPQVTIKATEEGVLDVRGQNWTEDSEKAPDPEANK